jgi:prephenate dehydrogenase
MWRMSQPLQSQSSSARYRQVAIVGVGLIGGSLGLALRQRRLAGEVIGIGRKQSSLKKALDCGAVDRATTDLKAGVAEAPMVVVATPVGLVPRLVREIAAICPADSLITDVSSVKGAICRDLASIDSFIGSHPLAGDHRSGVDHARCDLLSGKVVVVTPSPGGQEGASGKEDMISSRKGSPSLRQRVTQFWESLGAIVISLDSEEHDRALAATSHLPHWVASALAGATPEKWLPLVATGWRDTTRIAAADPLLWEQIFAKNKAGLLESLDRFLERLARMREALEAETPLTPLLNEAKRIRDAVGD